MNVNLNILLCSLLTYFDDCRTSYVRMTLTNLAILNNQRLKFEIAYLSECMCNISIQSFVIIFWYLLRNL